MARTLNLTIFFCKDSAVGNQPPHSNCSGTSGQGERNARTIVLVTTAVVIRRSYRTSKGLTMLQMYSDKDDDNGTMTLIMTR